MGLLKDALGPVLGLGQPNNGLNGPMSVFKKTSSKHTTSNPTTHSFEYGYDSPPHYQLISPSRSFRPLAIPQVSHGQGKPFLRCYSNELIQYDISKSDFIQVIDRLNEAIIPNPENQIFQMAAQTAGYFVPGVDGIAIAAARIGVGVGTAIGHGGMLAKRLSQANLTLFIPRGLEICIGKQQNVDQEAGFSPPSRGFQASIDPEERIEQYDDYLMPISATYTAQQRVGRQDPIAMIGRGMTARDNQRKVSRATRERNRGRRTKKGDSLEADLQWLIVRKAQPNSTAQWQRMLQQSEDAAAKEQPEDNRLHS